MRSIFKHLRPQWKAVLLIVVFLLVQAVCDLALPTYTSSLIDVGIQNSGVEYAVPVSIRASSYEAVAQQMTADEQALWQQNYTQHGEVYTLHEDADQEALDQAFTTPITLAALGSRGTPATRDDLRLMGDQTVHSTAISFVKSEYEALGVDLSDIQTSYLLRTGGKMLAMALGMALAVVVVSFLAARVGASVGRDLRGKVFQKVVHFSGAEFSKFSTASLITRSTSDIQQIQLVVTMLLRMVAYAPILALGGIVMVIRTSSGMEWIIVLAVALLLALIGVLMTVAMPKFKKMQVLVDHVNLVAREILTGLSVIRAFGREKVEEQRFDGANRDLTRNMLFTNRCMSFMLPCMMLLMNGISVLIVWTASHRIDAGALGVGEMTAFITYTMMIVMSFLMLAMMSIMLPRAAVSSERIDEVLATEPTIHNPASPEPFAVSDGVVRFEHVSFHYPEASDNVLTDIDFEARPGQTTAIIGSTGCGKSTLINLIPRFYDVTEGRITIDGQDVRHMDLHALRGLIGLAPQKGVLFSGTIVSNICYGAPDATADTVHEAAAIAQATEFIEGKPTGYDSPIAQGGSNVSGGQKQRLSIARAIARDPKIYIFDDTFSALDFKTDAALRRALGPKTQKSTVIIVAQRISTILHADQILVLDDEGRLVGKGTHAELMASCETYQQIARSQLSEEELKEGA
ncbi:MAG: ABC transporter ATP-binding protein [Butyricicoccus sp.]|nr:ABC transporter ATP-binding protein [Butyricicoccus sp.]